jgi:hypothetical protein
MIKLKSECPLKETPPACGAAAEIAKKADRDWTHHKKY